MDSGGLLALRTSRESSGAHPRPILGRVSDCKKSHVQVLNSLSYDLLIIVLARSVLIAFGSEHWSERLNVEHLFSER